MNDDHEMQQPAKPAAIDFTRRRPARSAVDPASLETAVEGVRRGFPELTDVGASGEVVAHGTDDGVRDEKGAEHSPRSAKVTSKKSKTEKSSTAKRNFRRERPATVVLSHTMGVRMTVEEREAIEEVAAAKGFDNASQFIRSLALAEIKKKL